MVAEESAQDAQHTNLYAARFHKGNGETFVLSEEARPVYLVFWAEW